MPGAWLSAIAAATYDYPNLAAYLVRCEAQPAFKRAFAAQLAVFTGKPPVR